MAHGIPHGGFGGPQDFWWDYPRLLVKSVWDKSGMGRDAFIEAAAILTDINHPNPVEGVAEVWGALGADQPYNPGYQNLRIGETEAARAARLPAPPSAEEVSKARKIYDSGASAFPGTEAHAGSKPWGTRDPMHPARIQLERELGARGMSEQRAKFADRSAQSRVDRARSKLDVLAKSYGFRSIEDFELSKYTGRDPYAGDLSPTKAHLDMQALPEYDRLHIELEEAMRQKDAAARSLREQSFKAGQPVSDPREELRRQATAEADRRKRLRSKAADFDEFTRAQEAGPEAAEKYQKEIRRRKRIAYQKQQKKKGLNPLKGEGGFMRGVAPSARSTAARGLSTALGAVAAPFVDYALDPESRTPEQFARAREEEITGMVPGLVSPSELPPPAVLPTDRRKAVESTQGMVGVAPNPESDNVTEQEVRAYISNKMAKGDRLPSWAERITSFKNGRLVVKPVNPRSRARKGAAERMKD